MIRFFVSRKDKSGGGVAIFTKNNLRAKVVVNASFSINEVIDCISVEIETKEKNIVICCVYRPPNRNVNDFTSQLEGLLQMFHNKIVFLAGDMNINILNYAKHTDTNNFVDLLYSKGMYPLITKPTRITSTCATLLDNIFTNEYRLISKSGVLICDVSDHLPVFQICSYNVDDCTDRKTESRFAYKRHVDECSMTNFINEIANVNWETIERENDPNIAYDLFIEKVTQLYDTCCPVKRVKIKNNKNHKPWLTKGLINATKKKRLLYEQSLKHGTNISVDKYKKYKNKLTYILRCEQKRYYSNLLSQHKGNMKQTWKVLNECMCKSKSQATFPRCFNSNNVEVVKNQDIANGFNQFFVGVGPSLAKNIPDCDNSFRDYFTNRSELSMFLEPTCEQEIVSVIKLFQNKTSSGYDGIDMNVVKKISNFIAKPFSNICNKSFESGVFPQNMKLAKVVPIYKAGDNKLYTNYRPVSLLPQFSKVLEKLFNVRLMSYINKNNVLYKGQYGFRQKLSTSLAIIDLTEEISSQIDKRSITIGVFIDLKKAFDTIDHKILLNKLEIYGVRGVALNWLKSYLSDRKQFVKFNDSDSDELTIQCGIPQGSILGPTLFILYINDLHNVSKILNFILFADDTNIFLSGSNLTDLCNVMSNELKKLDVWFRVNKLSLNVSKTNFMVFGNKKNEECKIYINDIEIEEVSSTKFLGVIIDNKLNWQRQIQNVQRKVSKSVSILYRVKNLLDTNALLMIYNSLILPYIHSLGCVCGHLRFISKYVT